MQGKGQLIFVYNAESGWAQGVLDTAHKLFSPETYSCELCGLTYGLLSMKASWKAFLSELPLEHIFLHRDEFRSQTWNSLPEEIQLPLVFLESEKGTQILLSAADFKVIRTLDELIVNLREKLAREFS